MNPRRSLALISAAALTAAIAGCAPITVTSFTGQGVRVDTYRTYGWADAVDTGVPGDPRLDNNPFFHEYLRGAIERHLVSRGYEPTVLRPDVYVHYHASTRQKVHVSDQEPAADRRRERRAEVYDEGTVVIDLTDARTGALVWRGAADSGLAGAVNDQTRMEEAIERVVGRILGRLPRRS